jgi:hypothetical protein
LRTAGIVDVLGGVAREISDCGIDLAERNLHILSVKQGVQLRLSERFDVDLALVQSRSRKYRSTSLKYLESASYRLHGMRESAQNIDNTRVTRKIFPLKDLGDVAVE